MYPDICMSTPRTFEETRKEQRVTHLSIWNTWAFVMPDNGAISDALDDSRIHLSPLGRDINVNLGTWN